MKTFNLKNSIVSILSIVAITLFAISCSSDDDSSGGGGTPVIESVSLAKNDSLVEQGYAKNMYIIRGNNFNGTKKVYFNETDTYFNPNLVTNELIIITIDGDTPYADTTDEIRVVTNHGEAVYSFIVAPPAPEVMSFNPVNAAAGEQFTIYGNYFLEPVVMVGEVEAEVVSSTLTEIVAIMPPDSDYKRVTVQNISGESTWGTAVGTAIYDDVFYAPWDIEAWNNHEYVTNKAEAYQGTTFIKKEIPGWDNIQGNWAWDDQLSQYTGIHFSVRSDDEGKLVLIFNGNNWGDENFAFETGTEWTEYSYTWEELGGMPEALQNISFQEFTGETHNYYFDNIGFTVAE